jgi:hypothetical protein
MKKLILILTLITSFAVLAQDSSATTPKDPAAIGSVAPGSNRRQKMTELRKRIKEDAAAMHTKIKVACVSDATTAGCQDKEGPPLMRCIRAYREANQNFILSDSCRTILGERHDMRKEHQKQKRQVKKEIKEERKAQKASGVPQSPVPQSTK